MSSEDQALVFDCAGDELIGVISHASDGTTSDTGVLVIVGGPQYRAGSHRQFVLLARELARQGFACMRFDVRGMGDSAGEARSFEAIDDDVRAAIDAFVAQLPHLKRIVLWGLCDGASAACFYLPTDPRVHGAVLLNPWVKTDAGEAKVYLKHYYLNRLMDKSFWKKLLTGGVSLGRSVSDLAGTVSRASGSGGAADASLPLPERMAQALKRADKPFLVVLSGRDYVAREFQQSVDANPAWNGLSAAAHPVEIPAADHTFSSAALRDEVADLTVQWLRQMDAAPT